MSTTKLSQYVIISPLELPALVRKSLKSTLLSILSSFCYCLIGY